jgi:antirestriction protein ArdC
MVKECPAHLLNTEIKGTVVTQEYWESLPDFGDNKFQRSKFSLVRDRVTFWDIGEKETGKIKDDGTPEMRKTFLLKYYYVVWEGYTSLYEGEPEEAPKSPRFNAGDALMKFYTTREGVRLMEEEGSEAFYRPFDDSIHLPAMEQFKHMEEFYSTAFHEMTHSTGVKKRLDRDMGGTFGSKSYAREELVAEIGAAFLTNLFGIRTDKVERNNKAYIQSWIQKLQKDPNLIITAATKAEKAMDFILDGFEEPKEEPKKEEKKRGEKKVKKEKPKMTKDELITKMGNIVKRYIKHYKTDFTDFDVKKIDNIIKAKAYGEYLWSVRECGTWLIEADDTEWKNLLNDQYGDNHRWYTLTYSADGWTFKRGAR